jgi:Ca-activated chloride channel family protein
MRAELQEQVVQLGLDYRLATQFTSFEAAEEQVVTSGGKSRRVEVPVNMLEGMSHAAVFGVPGGAVGGVAGGAGANPAASQGL